MTVKETITKTGIKPSSSFAGVETADDWIFAINTSGTAATVNDYTVCVGNIKSHIGTLNNKTSESVYIRQGPQTTRTAVQEQIKFEGDRYPGNDFQDFVLGHDRLFATGQDAKVDYVYFSIRTGKGTKGTGTLIPDTHSGGSAGERATFSGTLYSDGVPEAYTYTAA